MILSLETSSRAVGVAVLRGNSVLAEKKGDKNFSQSSQLLFDIREILQKVNISLKQIDLLAVAVGPGSFTGLRIGIATAKALAKALKLPICGISTLLAATADVQKNKEIYVVLPAGRSEYFVQCFMKSEDEDLIQTSEIKIYNIENLIEKVAEKYDSRWIALPETIELLSNGILKESKSFHCLPENLAISVGKIAYEVFLQDELEKNPPDAIYVRSAEIGMGKNAK